MESDVLREDDTPVLNAISLELRGVTTELIVAYTLLQLQRSMEARTFTVQLAAELAKRVRAEGKGR